MLSIGIGEIQKNISILTKLTETIEIVDKRKKKVVAIVYPVKKDSIVKKLAGKYKIRVKKSNVSLTEIKKFSFAEAMKKKYGLSS